MRRFFAKLANLFRGPRVESEMAREIESHLAMMQDDFERRGLSPEEARLAARRSYGGTVPTGMEQDTRTVRFDKKGI